MVQIKQIKITNLQDCIKIINKSFATVASEFNLSEKNCPRHPSFMKIDTLQKRFMDGYQMFGIYEQEKLVRIKQIMRNERHHFKSMLFSIYKKVIDFDVVSSITIISERRRTDETDDDQ